MTIYKSSAKSNYSKIDNEVFQSDKLSNSAKGLLAYLLTLPPSWHITIRSLESQLKDGKSAIASQLKELINYGLVKPVITRNAHGHIIHREYDVYSNLNVVLDPKNRDQGQLDPDLLDPDLLDPDFLDQVKADTYKQYSRSRKKEKNKTSSSSVPPFEASLTDFWIEEEAEDEDLHKHSFSSVGVKDPVPNTDTPEGEDAKQVSVDQNQTSTESVLIDPLNALKDAVKDKVPKEHLEGFIAFYLAEVKSRKIKSPLKYLEKAFNDLWIVYASKTTNKSFSVHKAQKTSKKSTKQNSPVRSNSQYLGACRTTTDNMYGKQDMKPQGETQIGLGIQAKIKERLQKEQEDGTLDKVIDRYLI